MADAAAFLLALWSGAGHVAAPLVPAYLARRRRAGKEDPLRLAEKLGRPGLARPDGPLVWIHAASVGETVSTLALVDRLRDRGAALLLTTGTVTAAAVAGERLAGRALHQYAPLDAAPFVRRFLDHWRPDLVLNVESELWPATVAALHRRRVPLVVVNGRLSPRSARGWARLPAAARAVFSRLTVVLAQTPADAERFRTAGAGDVRVLGNLKFDAVAPAADAAELARVAGAVAGRPLWLAASTTAPEEAAAAHVHRRLAGDHPGLLTVIVPRHPARGAELVAELTAAGLVVARRSTGALPGPDTDVYLADTLGELGLFYRLAPIAFVGGSLNDRGGQNPIEASLLDTAVLHGPRVPNVAAVYADLDAAGASRVVADADDLAAAVGRLIADPAAVAAMAEAGRAEVTAGAGALDRTLAALRPLWPAPTAWSRDGG
jgi:3-deoxy-D-manno-octulosonic-acid transferase